jgi:alkanesulfonate monooxygenase SsuD/methylene tetrahydromethanopterin reductase-like flavin-dependent oxidoreductase (luciferase family)
VHFGVRFDLRNPPQWGRPWDRYYAEFLDLVEWADANGFDQFTLAEHHFVEDGYCPSPLTVAAAVAARTRRMRIILNLVVLPFRHPVQLAEEAALVDILSGGRLSLVVGAGYRQSEFDAYGISPAERGGRMEEGVQILKKCWEEDEFSFEGKYWKLKNVRVQPKPIQKPRPEIRMGGNSEGAAKRAARHADGFLGMGYRANRVYQAELIRLGKARPEQFQAEAAPPPMPVFLFVSEDPERDWPVIGPHALYDANSYARFVAEDARGILRAFPAEDIAGLRAAGQYTIQTPEETIALGKQAEAALGPDAALTFHPLMGGIPIERARRSLELIVRDVMPAFGRSSDSR